MRAIVAPIIFVACLLAFTGCGDLFDDMDQRGRAPTGQEDERSDWADGLGPHPNYSTSAADDRLAQATWTLLTVTERNDICDQFWRELDQDIHDYLTSPPNPMTSGEAWAMINLMWDRC